MWFIPLVDISDKRHTTGGSSKLWSWSGLKRSHILSKICDGSDRSKKMSAWWPMLTTQHQRPSLIPLGSHTTITHLLPKFWSAKLTTKYIALARPFARNLEQVFPNDASSSNFCDCGRWVDFVPTKNGKQWLKGSSSSRIGCYLFRACL